MMATAVAGIGGGPMSGFIMTRLAGLGGMPCWQWLFLLEGVPAVTLGLFAFIFLGDSPADVRWFHEREKDLIARDLLADETS
jgi:MFS family permease